jgi:hypothetical protein
LRVVQSHIGHVGSGTVGSYSDVGAVALVSHILGSSCCNQTLAGGAGARALVTVSTVVSVVSGFSIITLSIIALSGISVVCISLVHSWRNTAVAGLLGLTTNGLIETVTSIVGKSQVS